MSRSTTALARLALVAVSLAAPAAIAASQIVPPSPIAFESVHVRMTVDSCTFNEGTVRVAYVDGAIVVTQQLSQCLVPGAPRVVDVRLGALPAGSYRVNVYGTPQPTGAPTETIALTVVPRVEIAVFPPPPRPLADYDGLWWDATQPGWGLTLHQAAHDALFGAWFVFNASGAPTWYSLQAGRWTSATTWAGTLYRTRASGPIETHFPSATTEAAGDVSFDFEPVPLTGTAFMMTQVDGIISVRTITRLRW